MAVQRNSQGWYNSRPKICFDDMQIANFLGFVTRTARKAPSQCYGEAPAYILYTVAFLRAPDPHPPQKPARHTRAKTA